VICFQFSSRTHAAIAKSTKEHYTLYPNNIKQHAMSSASLEIIKNNAYNPACMSRSMPAALNGLLTQAALDDFCDKLDELFVLSHEEHKRCIKFMVNGGHFLLLMMLLGVSYLRLGFWWFIGTVIFTFGFGVYVWLSTAPYIGVKANGRILNLIRFECDEMTRRTPFVSFHVVAGTIKHIDVNISVSATSSGVATGSNAIVEASPTSINDSYQQLNDVQVV
jgi:hypothetical protein